MTSREKFEQAIKARFGDLIDYRVCKNSDGEYMAWDMQVAWWAWQAAETSMAVQLANAESRCRELAAEISRRDEIFVPVYPDENTMNRMTDVFHDTAKIHCDEDSIFVDNAELVITAIINHYIKSDDAFLAEVRAQCLNAFIQHHSAELDAHIKNGGEQFDEKSVRIRDIIVSARLFREQIRKGAAL